MMLSLALKLNRMEKIDRAAGRQADPNLSP
jgi:hypothetical protein